MVTRPLEKRDYDHIVQVIEHRPMPFEKVRAALEDIRARALFEQLATSGVQLTGSYFK